MASGAAAASEPPPPCEASWDQLPDGVYVLTMAPGPDLFSIFGHTALYLRDRRFGIDRVYNFGVYDERDPNLVVGFLMGTQDYLLDTRSLRSSLDYYGSQSRPVLSQRLALSPPLRLRLYARLDALDRPDQRSYRYHWAEANCTTRVRDLLDEAFDGRLASETAQGAGTTLRREVLRHVAEDLPVWLGLAVGMSRGADRELSLWEAMFLPDQLFAALAAAQAPSGQPLVENTCTLQPGDTAFAPATPPDRSAWLWLVGLSVAALFALLGLALHRAAVRVLLAALLGCYGLAAGCLGAVCAALWARSTLTIFWDNANLMHANPGHFALVLLAPAVALAWRRGWRWAARASVVLAGISSLGALLWLTGLWDQDVAGPMGLFLPINIVLARVLTLPPAMGSRRQASLEQLRELGRG